MDSVALLSLFLVAIASIHTSLQQQLTHPGQCPPQQERGPCLNGCANDAACDRESKCCDTGCGKVCKKVNGAQFGQRQSLGVPPFGKATFPGSKGLPLQSQFFLQQQQQSQFLAGQPSLVNVGGCSRGLSLRNADGSTLVCGFGPRDFGCPQGFSCTFDNGLRSLVCCPKDNDTRSSSKEKDSPFQNPCHEGDPVKDEFGNRLKCDIPGGPLKQCPIGTLCVSGSCCPVSIAGLISVKPGNCPLPLPVAQSTSCQNDCTFDADCPAAAKCCFVGCGARCVVASPASPASSPGIGQPGFGPSNPSLGGPLSGNGASLSQFNPVPTRNDGVFTFQQPRGGINGQGQGQQGQFLNNGPPGFGGIPPRGPPGQGPPGNAQPQQNRGLANNRQFNQATN